MGVQDVILKLSKISAIEIDGKIELYRINSNNVDLMKDIRVNITEFKIGS